MPTELTATITGLENLVESLGASPQVINDASNKAVQRATLEAQATAKENAPIDKGYLRHSITNKIINEGKEVVGIIGTNVEYAQAQEFGTGIYGKSGSPITPKRGKVLAFRSKSGEMVYTKSVRGVRGKFYMKSGLEQARNFIDRELNNFLMQQIKEGLKFNA